MSLAYRTLFRNKVRPLLSAAGAARSVMLILVPNGFSSGVYGRPSSYLRNPEVVLDDSTSDTGSGGVRKV